MTKRVRLYMPPPVAAAVEEAEEGEGAPATRAACSFPSGVREEVAPTCIASRQLL